jgi:hypothetical protein
MASFTEDSCSGVKKAVLSALKQAILLPVTKLPNENHKTAMFTDYSGFGVAFFRCVDVHSCGLISHFLSVAHSSSFASYETRGSIVESM